MESPEERLQPNDEPPADGPEGAGDVDETEEEAETTSVPVSVVNRPKVLVKFVSAPVAEIKDIENTVRGRKSKKK